MDQLSELRGAASEAEVQAAHPAEESPSLPAKNSRVAVGKPL